MPGLVRRLLVVAAADGLLLQPLAPWDARGAPTVHISYLTHAVSVRPSDAATAEDRENALESHGIVGLVRIASSAYLLAVTRRDEVARLWQSPVYSVHDVALIPVSSQREAQNALTLASTSAVPGSSIGDDALDVEAAVGLDEDWLDDQVYKRDYSRPRSPRDGSRESGIAQDVIGKRGAYGRFADGWFSRMGWTTGQRRNLGMTSQNGFLKPEAMEMTAYSPRISEASSLGDAKIEPLSLDPDSSSPRPSLDALSPAAHTRVTSLVPRLVRAARLLFTSRTFFYSYDYDITTRLALRSPLQDSDTPLHKRVDPQYYYNRHLAAPFADAGLDAYVLPLMQGFVGQRAFAIKNPEAADQQPDAAAPSSIISDASTGEPGDIQDVHETARASREESFLVTLISRRSTKRAGLRYLRRGIDEEGNVANWAETEQILSSPSWDGASPVYSFLQLRGSIPVYFTQTTYALKPVPVLHGSPKANEKATEKHFNGLADAYGSIRAVSLVNEHGIEASIGQAYEDAVQSFNNAHRRPGAAPVEFEWFDFHTMCRGMKFDNVSLLVDSTLPFVKSVGWTAFCADSPGGGGGLEAQRGIVRTNCMDCLDRTNVVQSALAERVLNMQLSAMLARSDVDLRKDSGTDFFATLWADNGDAISKAYAGTSAMKGDFVRTGKRNAFGLLTDFSLTLSRYYHGFFEDLFATLCIDYMLGKVNERAFADFEDGVRGVDLSVDIDRLRREAVDQSSRGVVGDGEQLLCGWVVAAPEDGGPAAGAAAKQAKSTANTLMQEVILLLTDRHAVRVHYDWETEQVTQSCKVPLNHIKRLQWGTWVSETLTAAQTDEARNVGLLIIYEEAPSPASEAAKTKKTLSFKVLPTRSAVVRPEQLDTQSLGERDLVKHICEEIARAAEGFQDEKVEMEEAAIVDLAAARRNAGYLDQITYSVKRLVFG